jgi:hypothetical protein
MSMAALLTKVAVAPKQALEGREMSAGRTSDAEISQRILA